MLQSKQANMLIALSLVLAMSTLASAQESETNDRSDQSQQRLLANAENASRSITEMYQARMNREATSTIKTLAEMKSYLAETTELCAQKANEVLRPYPDPPNIDSKLMLALLRGSAIYYASDSKAYIVRCLELMTDDASGAETAIRLIGMGQRLEDSQMAAVFDHLTMNSAAPELLADEPDLWREFDAVRFRVSAKYAAKHHKRLTALGASA